jgi:hypothetical protein
MVCCWIARHGPPCSPPPASLVCSPGPLRTIRTATSTEPPAVPTSDDRPARQHERPRQLRETETLSQWLLSCSPSPHPIRFLRARRSSRIEILSAQMRPDRLRRPPAPPLHLPLSPRKHAPGAGSTTLSFTSHSKRHEWHAANADDGDDDYAGHGQPERHFQVVQRTARSVTVRAIPCPPPERLRADSLRVP